MTGRQSEPALPLDDLTPAPARGRCPVCSGDQALTPRGLIHAHGPLWGRCPGGGRPPARTVARLADAAQASPRGTT